MSTMNLIGRRRIFAKVWAEQGAETSTLNMPGRDHFTALSALAEPDHDLFAAALKLLGLN